ncbi:hypothetical protein GCM10010909_27490 [Acidocella aquatica]|uniref:F5/8 type C domain-containing protein n=1 Tax=Acidocella aquatica TaxID=1922313 RepID=A0ABQ6A9U5_9PROT|nr:glycosyltransferase family 2 protein [Acidocella aquatica]GLR68068.1 hypothetical protein GCM10010909_27490 [Acidocella aquatica]
MTHKYRFVIAACARWETRYAVEWLNYHRAIGFEHVYLYCNDDDPRALYETVLPFTQGPAPFVTFRFYPDQGQHRKMMLHFLAHDQHAAEWISFLDLDEFIRLPPGQSIAQFIAPLAPVADCVLFNWVFFGPNGHKTPPDRPVLESYTRREALVHPFTKYVARSTVFNDPQLFQKCLDNSFVHRLDEYLARPIRSVNVLGEDMAGYYADFPAGAAAFARHPPRQERLFATAMIHHYAFRSEQAFAGRVARGLNGNFAGEKIWGELAAEPERYREFLASVNAVEDRRLAEFQQNEAGKAQPANARPAPAAAMPPGLRLGIAITTFNRRELVVDLAVKIRALTSGPHELVVCDDGSTDGTAQTLRAMGVRVIGGTNRGIAWNKNRGIYYLLHVSQCDVIILLDDDIVPVTPGWEVEWIEAAWRYGHVNHAHPAYKNSLVAGALTAADPGLASTIPGWALAFNRFILASIGYMDVRFGRYGHEHSDLSFRALRTGHGGITVQEAAGQKALFYVIDGGLRGVPSVTSGTPEELQANGRLLMELGAEPVYRHVWREDAQMRAFLAEIAAAAPDELAPIIGTTNEFASLEAYLGHQGDPPALAAPDHAFVSDGNISRGKPVMQSPIPAAAPCWQVDLGGFATIREIRVHAPRGASFSLSVSIDGESWTEITREEDDEVVGGGGAPFIWAGPGAAWARFVRVTLLGRDYLHLDQVEVFGAMTHPGGTL